MNSTQQCAAADKPVNNELDVTGNPLTKVNCDRQIMFISATATRQHATMSHMPC